MSLLPVIVSIGGINPAGRISAHHAYRRLVFEHLGERDAKHTLACLAGLMGLDADGGHAAASTRQILDGTLIRRIEKDCFDPDAVHYQRRIKLLPGPSGCIDLHMENTDRPRSLPKDAVLKETGPGRICLSSEDALEVLLPDRQASRVQSAGQLPSGFRPESLYPARAHPRGLRLSIYAASDAVCSIGVAWREILAKVRPDEVAVYAGSAMGQLDGNASGGMMGAYLAGRRITSKQLPLGLAEMPADFVNAYVLGGLGGAGCKVGACATFLYNLELGVEDIRSGRRRVVLVGAAEAPLVPEVIEGYRAMRALAEDEALRELDGAAQADYRRACRPFAANCGFVMAESAVFMTLMDDELAVELGAPILGAAGAVFVNADGYKKSISSPGVGNYVTVGKTLAVARAILGEADLRNSTYVHAHGTGTPQNRVTESSILSMMAGVFGIKNWPVAAIKSYVGHSLASAGGDQMAAVLGVWEHGLIPGIKTIDRIAADVRQEHLHFLLDDLEVGPEGTCAALVNAKGFGGNNSTALILAPQVVRKMLERKHGRAALLRYAGKNEQVKANCAQYDQDNIAGRWRPIYSFGESRVLEEADLEIEATAIRIAGHERAVSLQIDNPYTDMT